MSADARREVVIRAALVEFSARGLHGTTTEDIARRAGVSQPYLFRLFPSKKALFMAACACATGRMIAAFEAAAEGRYGIDAAQAMDRVCRRLLVEDHAVLRMQLQQFAACDDDEIRGQARGGLERILGTAGVLTGAPLDERSSIVARGMLAGVLHIVQGAQATSGEDGRGSTP
jgi:AcrR family transcriptional regulator